MGEVIADHRKKRGYRTQEAFAIATGVDKRTIQEWETNTMTTDMGRRIFLAKLLSIPPALLGLEWHQIVSETGGEAHQNPLLSMAELLEEDAFYAYEDILVMGHEYIHNGGSVDVALRVARRLRKLEKVVLHAREPEKEAWLSLLCRYYQLSSRLRQQCLKDDVTASRHACLAVRLARDLEDQELLAAALVHSACTSTQQGNYKQARQDIAAALTSIDRLKNSPLKGNIYLEAANINTPFATTDRALQQQCRLWQEKAANLLYKGQAESDDTFFRFNLSAVHHEKAKSLLRWQNSLAERRAAQSKLTTAHETLPPELAVWRAYYHITEARLYLADNDLEAAAQTAKAALKVARGLHSRLVESEVEAFYAQLTTLGPTNPYVQNLGVEIGVFS
jgi:transcriptional regulator with XRE-family HTH domain